jgi:hypothetical protein
MDEIRYYLGVFILLSEFMAAAVGIIKFKKFRANYWKYFIYYLIFIFLAEMTSEFILGNFKGARGYFYDFFVIPIEFVFLYWLYGYKSLKNPKIFWTSSGIYLLSFIPHLLLFKEISLIFSFNYIVGTFLLSLMIILEFNKQMKTDDILKFRENMMFYVNTGVCLLYVGSLPYFAFYSLLSQDIARRDNYYIFFMITNILMYQLFSIALLWGKPNT